MVSKNFKKITVIISVQSQENLLFAYAKTKAWISFCFLDSTIWLHYKSEISSFLVYTVFVQPGLCCNWPTTGRDRFSGDAAHLSLVVRTPAFCICENKDANQLRGNCEADQRLCFRYIDSTIPLLPTYEISSL